MREGDRDTAAAEFASANRRCAMGSTLANGWRERVVIPQLDNPAVKMQLIAIRGQALTESAGRSADN